MSTTTALDVTTLDKHLFRGGYCLVVDGVAIEVGYDPTDDTYLIAYAWVPDDFADGFRPSTVNESIAEWVKHAPAGHPAPWDGCYGCLGTGTLQWHGIAPGSACSCVTTDPDRL